MYTIGLDVGGTTVKAGLADDAGHLLRIASQPTPGEDLQDLLDTLQHLVSHLAQDDSVGAVGVGLPGLASSETGTIHTSPNIPCLEGSQIAPRLGSQTGLPVIVANDADMSAWGEFSAGAGVHTQHMVGLTLGTGVGSGLILNGQIYNGARGYAAEAGHIVVEPEGPPCSCGSRGCLEALASAKGIVSLARIQLSAEEAAPIPEPWSSESLCQAALDGHKGARAVFQQAGTYLGIACATLINLLNPEVIVIAGGVMTAGDLILKPAISEAKKRAFPVSFDSCRIVPAQLGNQAGTVGAALYARRVIQT